jgi:hypothetical protein
MYAAKVNGPHKSGNNELTLYKLESGRKRLDKKTGTYMLEYIWRNPKTGGVQGSDYTIFTAKEAKPMIAADSLFDHVNLF